LPPPDNKDKKSKGKRWQVRRTKFHMYLPLEHRRKGTRRRKRKRKSPHLAVQTPAPRNDFIQQSHSCPSFAISSPIHLPQNCHLPQAGAGALGVLHDPLHALP
ncbi:unnamed protein product, partial [Phaeothamnion confervicola]